MRLLYGLYGIIFSNTSRQKENNIRSTRLRKGHHPRQRCCCTLHFNIRYQNFLMITRFQLGLVAISVLGVVSIRSPVCGPSLVACEGDHERRTRTEQGTRRAQRDTHPVTVTHSNVRYQIFFTRFQLGKATKGTTPLTT